MHTVYADRVNMHEASQRNFPEKKNHHGGIFSPKYILIVILGSPVENHSFEPKNVCLTLKI